MRYLFTFLILGIVLAIVIASPSKHAKEMSNVDDIETEVKESAMSAGASESDEDEDDMEAQDENGDDGVAALAWRRPTRVLRCSLVYTNKHTCSFNRTYFTCRRMKQRRCRYIYKRRG